MFLSASSSCTRSPRKRAMLSSTTYCRVALDSLVLSCITRTCPMASIILVLTFHRAVSQSRYVLLWKNLAGPTTFRKLCPSLSMSWALSALIRRTLSAFWAIAWLVRSRNRAMILRALRTYFFLFQASREKSHSLNRGSMMMYVSLIFWFRKSSTAFICLPFSTLSRSWV